MLASDTVHDERSTTSVHWCCTNLAHLANANIMYRNHTNYVHLSHANLMLLTQVDIPLW